MINNAAKDFHILTTGWMFYIIILIVY